MNIRITRNALLATTVLSLGLSIGAQAYAQEAQPEAVQSAEESGIRDIVVTARRTTENLQTTPVAVTALDATALDEKQISNVYQISQATPSLSVQSGGTGNAGLIYLAIRGNAQNSPNSASDSAVGIYVDGVYYGRPMIGNMGLLDMASAEVLRGTQGTLFGRNTTGGALNMTTVQPGNDFTGYVRGSYGNYNFAEVEGAVTVPLITSGDDLSLRVAGRYVSHDAYGKNLNEGGIDAGELKHEYAGRATLRYAPSEIPLTLTIGADIIRTKDTQNNVALVGVNPTGGAAQLYAGQLAGAGLALTDFLQKQDNNFYNTYALRDTGIANIDDPYNHNEAEGVYGTIDYDLGGASIKSITAFRHSNTGDQADIDGTPLPIISYASDYIQRQVSEELQISGKSGNLDWIFGGMYFHEWGIENSDSASFQRTDLQFLALNPAFGPAYAAGSISPSNNNNSDFDATSWAAFGQANYHINDKLRVTAGLRYTWDKRSINRHGIQAINGADENIINPNPALGFPISVKLAGTCAVGDNAGTVVPAGECNDPHTAKFSYPAWTLGIDYQLDEGQFVYAKTGGAAMAGGFNTRLTPPGFDSFNPEKVKDAEIGYKGEFLDRRLRTNLAAFYVWRNDAQNIVNAFNNGTLTQYTQNAGNVRAYGLEFEATAQPWAGMEITTGVSRLWTHYQDGSFTGISGVADPVTGEFGVIDRSGEAVPQSPEWTFNIGGTQTIPLNNGKFLATLNYAYSSSRNLGQDTPDTTYDVNPNNPNDTKAKRIADYAVYNELSVLKGYGVLNGRLAVQLDNGFEVSVWGKNMLGEHYYSSLFNGYLSLGTAVQFQANPATYGATVGFNF